MTVTPSPDGPAFEDSRRDAAFAELAEMVDAVAQIRTEALDRRQQELDDSLQLVRDPALRKAVTGNPALAARLDEVEASGGARAAEIAATRTALANSVSQVRAQLETGPRRRPGGR
jgi:ribonuclease PH